MASETPVKIGKINMGKGKNKRKKNYAKLFKASSTGLSRLEIYDDEKSSLKGITTELIVAEDVVKIHPDFPGSSKSEFLFGVMAKDNNLYIFGVQTDLDRKGWVQDLSSVLFKCQQTNRGQGRHSVVRSSTITDNDIYDSAEEYVRDHSVKISEETAKRLYVQKNSKAKLVVESSNITIISSDGALMGRWGIEHLRRFGYSDTDFHFEAGRKSELGPGNFSFITDKGKSIHMMVQREKKACRGGSVRSNAGDTELPSAPQTPVGQDQSYNMDLDGATYEELAVTQQPSNRPTKGVIPHKPPRNTEPTSPTTKQHPGAVYYSNQQSLNNIGMTQVYAEVTEPHNAWQKHGRDVDDDTQSIYEDQVYDYDRMNHTTPTNTEGDLYSTSTGEQTETPPANIEQLYAVVNKKNK